MSRHHLAISRQMSRKTSNRHANMPLSNAFHKTLFSEINYQQRGVGTSGPSFDENSSIASCMLFRYTSLSVFDR
jgi:hypothetical protein